MTDSPLLSIYTVDITQYSKNDRTVKLVVDIADYYKYKAELPTCTMDDFCEHVCEIYRMSIKETTCRTNIIVGILPSSHNLFKEK